MDDNLYDAEPFQLEEGLTNEEALASLLEYGKKYPSLHKHMQMFTPEDMGSLIFMGNGPGINIHGMHYPDDALDLEKIPNIFPGSEEGTIIAAFPDSLVTKAIEFITEKIEPDLQNIFWEKMVGAMLESVIDILDGEMPSFDLDKLL